MSVTLTIQPSTKDTYCDEFDPTSNYGSRAYLNIYDRKLYTIRSLLEFSLSGLPAGAILESASFMLRYYAKSGTDPSGKTVWAYKLSQVDWVELEATWNRYKALTNWTTAGGDYVTSSPAGGSTTLPASYDWMTWNVLAIVLDAIAGGIAAEFLVRFGTEKLDTGYSLGTFYSKDYTTDTSLCPKLVIVYKLPSKRGWCSK